MKPLQSVSGPVVKSVVAPTSGPTSGKVRIDTDPKSSSHKGLLGMYETLFRRFKIFGTMIVLLPMYGVGACCFGVALLPSVQLYRTVSPMIQDLEPVGQLVGTSLLLALGYIIFGFTLIFVVPVFNFAFRAYPKPWRGPYYSLQTIRWGIHNGLTYIPRYIFMEYLTPTPFSNLFYRMMGMKIGKDVQINTTQISDPCLIELQDRVTLGGNVTLIAHYAQGGFLVIAPVKIGMGATIGLRAIIMGDVEIGEKAKVMPNSVVLPKTRIPAGETWGGIPAQKIDAASLVKRNK